MTNNIFEKFSDFLSENNEDLLTTFTEWKDNYNATVSTQTQAISKDKHTNTSHTDVAAKNNDTTWQNSKPHADHGNHNNSGGHGNGHTNSHINDGSSTDWTGAHTNYGHNNWSNGWHNNHGNHGNSAPHSNSPSIPHGNTHTNTDYQQAAAQNFGFNHTNYLPTEPNLFESPTYYKGTVLIQTTSYDKNSDVIYYRIEVKKDGYN